MMDFALHLIGYAIIDAVLIVSIVALVDVFRRGKEEAAREIIEREMASAPPEPVHPDLMERWRFEGGYDARLDHVPADSEEVALYQNVSRGSLPQRQGGTDEKH